MYVHVLLYYTGANIKGRHLSDSGLILADTIRGYMQAMDIPNGLQSLGFTSNDIPNLVTGTLPQVCIYTYTVKSPYKEHFGIWHRSSS